MMLNRPARDAGVFLSHTGVFFKWATSLSRTGKFWQSVGSDQVGWTSEPETFRALFRLNRNTHRLDNDHII